MYWTGFDTIQRANLDGSEVEDLVASGLVAPDGLALDLGGGKMYWTDSGTATIQRANLDGSEVEDLVTSGLVAPDGLTLDPGAGKMYWTDKGTAKIQRANLDGSEVEDLIASGLLRPEGLALDPDAGKIYWVDVRTAKIQRANLDGSEVEDLITSGLNGPIGLALDLRSNYRIHQQQGTVLYFPDYVDGGGWSVQLVLSNVGAAAATAVVDVYGQDGQSATDLFDSGSTLEVPSLGSRVLGSTGGGAIRARLDRGPDRYRNGHRPFDL